MKQKIFTKNDNTLKIESGKKIHLQQASIGNNGNLVDNSLIKIDVTIYGFLGEKKSLPSYNLNFYANKNQRSKTIISLFAKIPDSHGLINDGLRMEITLENLEDNEVTLTYLENIYINEFDSLPNNIPFEKIKTIKKEYKTIQKWYIGLVKENDLDENFEEKLLKFDNVYYFKGDPLITSEIYLALYKDGFEPIERIDENYLSSYQRFYICSKTPI